MNTRLVLILVAIVGLSGCNSGFKTDADPVTDSLVETSSTGLNKASTSRGDLQWTKSQDDAQDFKFEYQLKIPFGRVYGELSKMTKWMAPYACQWSSGIRASRVIDYAEGEIPCGAIVNTHWKNLTDVRLDPTSGSSDGFDYQVSGATIPVWLSRYTHQGQFTEMSLDTKSQVTRLSSRKFAEDISVRFIPQGSASRLEMCMNVPGVTINSVTQDVYLRAVKKILWFDWVLGSNLKVTPGWATYEYGRACFAADFTWRPGFSKPIVNLVATQNPRLQNVNYAGLDVKIEDWFLSMLDGIMDFFNFSIRKNLITQAQQTVNSYADGEIESGAWFSKFQSQTLLQETSQRLNQHFSDALTRTGIPSSPEDVRTRLMDICRRQKLSGKASWNQRFENFCQSVIDHVQIETQAFQIDQASKAAGCYDSFARIHDTKDSNGQNKWWADQCQFAAKFNITLPKGLSDYRVELEKLMLELVSEEGIPPQWIQALNELGVDDYLLDVVLEEVQKRGVNQIQAGDWKSNLAQVVKEAKDRLAGLR